MVTNEEYEHKVHYMALGYYANADAAHMSDHIELVKERAFDMLMWLKKTKGLDADLKTVIIAASLHDIGSCEDRERHAEHSYEIFKKDPQFKELGLTTYQEINIANSILQHSSHFDGHYYSIESEILASADRDEPDIYNILFRSTQYGKKHNPSDVVNGVCKYNISRYATYPSKDYRVPEWHFEYWNQKIPNSMKNLNIFFSNNEAVYKTVKMIYEDYSEKHVRNYIDNIIYQTTKKESFYTESFWKKFISPRRK